MRIPKLQLQKETLLLLAEQLRLYERLLQVLVYFA